MTNPIFRLVHIGGGMLIPEDVRIEIKKCIDSGAYFEIHEIEMYTDRVIRVYRIGGNE